MMDIGKNFGYEEDLAKSGIWVDVGDEARIRIAKEGNPKYQEFIRKKVKPIRRQVQNGTVPDERLDEIAIEAIAKHILVDWEGVELDGEPLEYNQENAKMLLDEFEDFREMVREISQDLSNYQGEGTKNS